MAWHPLPTPGSKILWKPDTQSNVRLSSGKGQHEG
eukprot:CAMPEP_0201282692 /NCGR_PEP_ID=MMETSP1317-20130820/6391_1 /ASSEMBLY_ACC=CAM_ASM_000770 /TAXON_ID=187299 /ORGANISM="Undescribed Undescribed, Strain Undescribed" /LENGTH=34 /DNA_ID= /DNA_START= /DNA_END= /DNA_ORIENTATION=